MTLCTARLAELTHAKLWGNNKLATHNHNFVHVYVYMHNLLGTNEHINYTVKTGVYISHKILCDHFTTQLTTFVV